MEQGVLETLVAARKLIELPERWTQGASARNPLTNRPVNPCSPKAGCWCMEGAIRAANPGVVFNMLTREAFDYRFVPHWFNDEKGRTHNQVLAAFDAAIEKLKKGSHE